MEYKEFEMIINSQAFRNNGIRKMVILLMGPTFNRERKSRRDKKTVAFILDVNNS